MNYSNSAIERPRSRRERPPTARMVFKGVIFKVWQWEQFLFDGTKVVFEQLERPDTVLVLPVLPNGHVVLAQETQPGVPPVIHTVGGKVEPDESPEDAARRELLEESGYVAEELRLWDAWQPVDKMDWAVFLFVAHGLSRPGNSTPDAGEQITLKTISATQLLLGNSDLKIDDYELLHQLYFARSEEHERERVARLLQWRM